MDEEAMAMVRIDTGARASGWETISRAMARRYGPGMPLSVGGMHPEGRGDELEGVSAYRTADHWQLITYALTELGDKRTDDPAWSGYGFEFSLRLPADADAPPEWAASMLSFLCRYVRSSSRPLHDGHFLLLPDWVAENGWPRPWPAVAFVIDPELDAIATPNGRVEFLQAIGLDQAALDELTGPPPWPGADLATQVRQHANRCHAGDPFHLSPAILPV